MTDPEWLKSTWDVISNQVKVDKIYLETHRDLLIIKKDEMQKIIKFFKDQGIEVAGGITYTIVVESFHDEPITINIVGAPAGNNIAKDMLTGERIKASERPAMSRGATAKSAYRVTLKPHSFRVLRFE